MRSLALAQAWKRPETVTFLLPEGSPGIEERIRAAGMGFESLPIKQFAEAAVDRALSLQEGVVVLDGYDFNSQHQAALSKEGRSVLVIDDYGHAGDYSARWILNQSASAGEQMYGRRGTHTQLLLGSPYALLREQFLPWLGWKRSIPKRASKLLITIGGSDPENLSARILESLANMGRFNLEVVLVAGSSNPHRQALQAAVDNSPLRVRIIHNALDMPSLMAWADVAVSGAGGTSNELCYMGLPSLLFVIAENQRHVAEHFSTMSAVVHAGEARDFEPRRFAEQLGNLIESQEQREAMSNRARGLVDGLGANRVRAAMLDRELSLRNAAEADGQLLFAWANDPVVRQASFHSAPIEWNDHQRWFAAKLRDPGSVIYIGENRDGEPVGQVRFDLDSERAVLSIAVAPGFRGRGWGKELLWFSVRKLVRAGLARRIDAFVKPDNQASIRLFESADFRRVGTETVGGQSALRFTWACEKESHAG